MKGFLNLFSMENDFAKYFTKCCSLFKYFVWNMGIPWSETFLTLQARSNFLVLYNFTKCFSGTKVDQVVNKCLNGCLIFQFVIFGSLKNYVH